MTLFNKLFGKGSTAVTAAPIQKVAIIRSSGTRETGWEVTGLIDNGLLVSTAGQFKCVPMVEVLRADPALLIGLTLRIRGSSGEFETDWRAASLRGPGNVLMVKPGLEKTVSLENVVAWNQRCCEVAQAA